MTTEETQVELQEQDAAQTREKEEEEVPVSNTTTDAADATEADVSEADLDQEEQEKLPMTGGAGGGAGGGGGGAGGDGGSSTGGGDASDAAAEKNGSVKLKIPDEEEEEKEMEEMEEVKFTGLSKEELLRVAGTPGWVRTRWALLLVFWLGWLGMLGGAVLLILQAPRCRDLPPTHWWNDGPLYQVGDIQAFTDSHNLKGLEQKVDSLSKLKVKGLVVGPLHVAPPDDAVSLRFEDISPETGNLEQFRGFVQAAHKKGISVVLDLTPNYQGSSGPWFSNTSVTSVAERLKSALVFWLNEGVDGVQLSGVERVSTIVPSLWSDIRAIVQNGTNQRQNRRVLIGVTERSSADDVSSLLNSTGVDLLLSQVLQGGDVDAAAAAAAVQSLYEAHGGSSLAWSLGGRGGRGGRGHLASLGGPALLRLHQLLLLTLPGTPVFNYGDEIGLMDQDNKSPQMLWDDTEELNDTLQEDQAERRSRRSLFVALSELRGKERSLMIGDFRLLSNSSSSLAFLREWDQSPRYVAVFNWAAEEAELQLSSAALPRRATVAVSTNATALPVDTEAELSRLQLGPGQAALLRFPYTG